MIDFTNINFSNTSNDVNNNANTNNNNNNNQNSAPNVNFAENNQRFNLLENALNQLNFQGQNNNSLSIVFIALFKLLYKLW